MLKGSAAMSREYGPVERQVADAQTRAWRADWYDPESSRLTSAFLRGVTDMLDDIMSSSAFGREYTSDVANGILFEHTYSRTFLRAIGWPAHQLYTELRITHVAYPKTTGYLREFYSIALDHGSDGEPLGGNSYIVQERAGGVMDAQVQSSVELFNSCMQCGSLPADTWQDATLYDMHWLAEEVWQLWRLQVYQDAPR